MGAAGDQQRKAAAKACDQFVGVEHPPREQAESDQVGRNRLGLADYPLVGMRKISGRAVDDSDVTPARSRAAATYCMPSSGEPSCSGEGGLMSKTRMG